jgi:hypothetical protein
VTRFRAERGVDPVAQLSEALRPFWGDPLAPRRIHWPLAIRAGRVRKKEVDP